MAFLAMPATGSISVRTALLERHGFRHVGTWHHGDPRSEGFELTADWQVATTVRNHFEWFFSYWCKETNGVSLADFNLDWLESFQARFWLWTGVPEKGFEGQPSGQLFGRYLRFATTVLRHERLHEDLGTWLGEKLFLGWENRRQHFRKQRGEYDAGMRAWMRRFEGEMGALGYEHEVD